VKDYTNFYASASQYIPVLVLIYAVEGRGFRRAKLGPTRRPQRTAYLLLTVAGAGEFFSIFQLSQGSPVGDRWLPLVIFGSVAAFFLAGLGMFNLIEEQQMSQNDDGGRPPEREGRD
jgi:hypothetical protein